MSKAMPTPAADGNTGSSSSSGCAPLAQPKNCVCQMCFQTGGDTSYLLSTAAVHQFLDERAIPTPFLFAYLLRLRKKMNSFYLCANCDSWVRRRNQAHAKSKKPASSGASAPPTSTNTATAVTAATPAAAATTATAATAATTAAAAGAAAPPEKTTLLAVDRLILSVMLPGTYPPPEMRITQRLIATIRKNGGHNWLATICPPLVVQSLRDNDIRLESRKVLKSLSVATWKSGRQQAVLGNAAFAKNIRCAQHGV